MSAEAIIQVSIVSAEAELFSGQARMVFVSGELGELGIAPRHTPLLTTLRPGQVRLQLVEDGGDDEAVFYISGGMLEVQPFAVTVLADTAQRAEDVDEAAAKAAEQRARQALEDRKGEVEYSKALGELAQAVAQLRAIRQLRKSK